MFFFAASAAFVGFVHSLAPGHWLPVVLVAKSRRWGARDLVLGAMVAASGHIVISNVLGLLTIGLETTILRNLHAQEDEIERFAALMLACFGFAYAAFSYFSHSRCHGHEHHGPRPTTRRRPYAFLFSLGLSPCVAALPIFLAASSRGAAATALAMTGFGLGVLGALIGATWVMFKGVAKLDHPVFEHYGDVITGASLVAMGAVLYFVHPF